MYEMAVNKFSQDNDADFINEAPVNFDILNEMKNDLEQVGAIQIYHKTLRLYLDSSPSYMQALRTAVEHKDVAEMLRIAHTFKSSNGTLGAEILAGLCREMEKMARENTTDDVDVMLIKIEDEYRRVEAVLSTELQNQH